MNWKTKNWRTMNWQTWNNWNFTSQKSWNYDVTLLTKEPNTATLTHFPPRITRWNHRCQPFRIGKIHNDTDLLATRLEQ